MSISTKLTVSASVLATAAIVGITSATTASADTTEPEATAAATTQVDTTSDAAITDEAKLVINGIDNDGVTIPTGDARVTYLEGKNFDAQTVQDKVNELLGATQAPVTYTLPAQTSTASTYVAPAATSSAATESTAQEAQPASQASAPASTATTAQSAASQPAATTGDSNSAKEWIANKESSGSYTAANGRYIGRYQLDASYLNGDYSAANQEKVADSYVAGRYGSWDNAKAHWLANGWY